MQSSQQLHRCSSSQAMHYISESFKSACSELAPSTPAVWFLYQFVYIECPRLAKDTLHTQKVTMRHRRGEKSQTIFS